MSTTPPITSFAATKVAVRTVDLVKAYGTASAPVLALRGVSLEIRAGERVALLGKSGSGKSTLLNVLGGLDRPTSGTALVGGRDLARLSARDLARHRLTTVGMIFQSFNLIPSRTALENVELPMVFAARPPRERRAAARQALEAVALGHRLDHRPAELSGGEHQRVAIARALVNNPDILLADEPTGNLDSATARDIVDLLTAHLRAHGTTLILVTHDEDLARRCADRILRMKDGQLLPEGA
jgi:predicted ABC-type transport system involved in lysophospholipase L1 biosynthesis ATPase subunit